MLVCCGNPAGQFLIPEEPDERRSLQRLFLVGVVTFRAICLKGVVTAEFFSIKRPCEPLVVRGTAGQGEREEAN